MRKFVTAAIIGVMALAGPTLAASASNSGLTASDRSGEESSGVSEYFLPVLGALLAAAAGATASTVLLDDKDKPVSP